MQLWWPWAVYNNILLLNKLPIEFLEIRRNNEMRKIFWNIPES